MRIPVAFRPVRARPRPRILAPVVTIATLIIIAIAIAFDPLPLVPFILLLMPNLTIRRALISTLLSWACMRGRGPASRSR